MCEPHLLAQRLHAGDGRLHFQSREAGINRMPAVSRWHASNCHIGVTDCLEFFDAMTRYYVVKAREVLVQKADERDWLCAFGQKGEALEIREQNRCGGCIFRLNLAVQLELVSS